MKQLVGYVGGAVVAFAVAALLTYYGFQLPLEEAASSGLVTAALAIAIVYMHTHRRVDLVRRGRYG